MIYRHISYESLPFSYETLRAPKYVTMARKTYKSVYEPVNPSKYVGDAKNIVCRSSWERFFCSNLDHNPNVEKWGSEEFAIEYISPKDGRIHRYFVDFIVKFKNGKAVMVEIKPFGQTVPPAVPKKKSNKALARFQEDTMVFLINQAKWNAAMTFARQKGMDFVVYTENELRKLGCPV